MGRRIANAVVYGAVGYVAGALGGGALVSALSANTHDRSLEAAMTGAFVCGPLAAAVASIAGFVRAGRRTPP